MHKAKRPRKVAIQLPDSDEENRSGRESDSGEDSDRSAGSGSTSVSSIPDASGTFRRQYNKLIDDCRKLEKKEGFSADVQQVMTKNIQAASNLFQQLSHPQGEGPSGVTGSQPPIRSTPADLYMAFLHTKMMTDVLKSKTDCIGMSSTFDMEVFMKALKRKLVTEDSPFYSPELASKFLAMEFAASAKTFPILTAVVGTFDRDAIFVPREKKPRAPIVRKKFDEVEKTQEEVNLTNYKKQDGPQKLAVALKRVLKQHTSATSKPTNLYQFVFDPRDLNKSVESIFYVAFLVHDGEAGLQKPPGSKLKDYAIDIKPVKKEVETGQSKDVVSSRRNHRNQYILSFSARTFKKLSKISKGDPIIPTDTASVQNNEEEEGSPGQS